MTQPIIGTSAVSKREIADKYIVNHYEGDWNDIYAAMDEYAQAYAAVQGSEAFLKVGDIFRTIAHGLEKINAALSGEPNEENAVKAFQISQELLSIIKQ